MKRSTGLLIGFASAAITIAGLFAFAGQAQFGQYGYRNGRYVQCSRYENNGNKSNVPDKKLESKTDYKQ